MTGWKAKIKNYLVKLGIALFMTVVFLAVVYGSDLLLTTLFSFITGE